MGEKARKIVPKRIGSLKVPKRLRKTLNRALGDPKTAEIATGALLAAATALAKRGLDRGTGAQGRDPARDADGRARQGADRTGASGPRSTAEDLGEIGQIVAGAASEAVRGVAASVTRLVGEAVEGLRRDRGHGPSGSTAESPVHRGPQEAGPAQSEPVGAEDRPVQSGPLDEVKTGEGDEFGTRDDNDDPFDGNDQSKPGPMTGAGP